MYFNDGKTKLRWTAGWTTILHRVLFSIRNQSCWFDKTNFFSSFFFLAVEFRRKYVKRRIPSVFLPTRWFRQIFAVCCSLIAGVFFNSRFFPALFFLLLYNLLFIFVIKLFEFSVRLGTYVIRPSHGVDKPEKKRKKETVTTRNGSVTRRRRRSFAQQGF